MAQTFNNIMKEEEEDIICLHKHSRQARFIWCNLVSKQKKSNPTKRLKEALKYAYSPFNFLQLYKYIGRFNKVLVLELKITVIFMN